ncbi:hypothetical protein ACFPM0_25095 [Pseudonocardia sulfidoxydans]|uniref:hypothetical protein n=1 Tax=Pseudonocardia sulfidoxydans TaxID=54011 RepID=UPI00360F66A3
MAPWSVVVRPRPCGSRRRRAVVGVVPVARHPGSWWRADRSVRLMRFFDSAHSTTGGRRRGDRAVWPGSCR